MAAPVESLIRISYQLCGLVHGATRAIARHESGGEHERLTDHSMLVDELRLQCSHINTERKYAINTPYDWPMGRFLAIAIQSGDRLLQTKAVIRINFPFGRARRVVVSA